jgi:hypothetical protein
MKPVGCDGIGFDYFYFGRNTQEQDDISQDMESILKVFEDFIGKNLPDTIKIISTNKPIKFNEKFIISHLITLIYLNHPSFRTRIKSIQENIYKQELNLILQHDIDSEFWNELKIEHPEITDNPNNYRIHPDNIAHSQFFIQSVDDYINIFMKLHWTVFINKTSIPFITSTNPVIELPPNNWPKKYFYGPPIFMRRHIISLTPTIHIQIQGIHKGSKLIRRKTIFLEKDILQINQDILYHSKISLMSQKTGIKEII